MRILMTTDTVGGVWTYCVELAEALEPHGVEIALATMGDPVSAVQREQVAALPNVELFESDFKLEWMNDPWADVDATGDWLCELEAAFAPDVVHLNGYAYGQKPFRAPVMIVAHSCCYSWWHAVRREAPPREWERYRHEVTGGLAGADVVVAPTQAMLSEIQRLYAPQVLSRVIYNGRDRWPKPLDTQKQPFVLAAGRVWDEAKNITALQAVATDLPWPIKVAGNAQHPDGRSIEAGALQLTGQLDSAALAELMTQASIYALPARYEPFGLSVLEAAIAGCALILGDIPSLREVWDDDALFINPDDTQQLKTKLQQLIDNPLERSRLAAASQQRAKRYSASVMARRYMDEYKRLTAHGGNLTPTDGSQHRRETVA